MVLKNHGFSFWPSDGRDLRDFWCNHNSPQSCCEEVEVTIPNHAIRRAALKGTNLRGQTPICGFLWVPAAFCGFLRKSAVFFEDLHFLDASFSRRRRESAKISENLRESAFGFGSSP